MVYPINPAQKKDFVKVSELTILQNVKLIEEEDEFNITPN